MERFKGQHAISFELVADEKEIRFIVGAPREAKDFVVKQVHAFHPGAEILEIPEYNIFEKEGVVEVAEIYKTGPPYFPVTTYEDLPLDPLNSITQSLAKMEKGDTAALQICISPAGSGWQGAGQQAIYNAQNPSAGGGSLPVEIAKGVFGNLIGQTQESEGSQRLPPVDEKFIEGVRKQISKNGFNVAIRVVVTASDRAVAQTHLHSILSSFEQFSAPHLASFRSKSPRFKKHFMVDFLYRYAPRWKPTVLNSEEFQKWLNEQRVDEVEAHAKAEDFMREYLGLEAYAQLMEKGELLFEVQKEEWKITRYGLVYRKQDETFNPVCVIRPKELPIPDFVVSALTTLKENPKAILGERR